MTPGLIVGVDPGTTTAFCALDLSGKLVKVKSEKHFSFNRVLAEIEKLGDVVVVATDMAKVPAFVEKVAASFSAVLFVPENSLGTLDKSVIVNSFLINLPTLSLKNKHEKDALAAALLAYTFYKNKLKRVEAKFAELELDLNNLDSVKKSVIFGKSMAKAIKELKSKGI